MASSKENYLKDLGSDGVNKTRVAVMREEKELLIGYSFIMLFSVSLWLISGLFTMGKFSPSLYDISRSF